MRAFWINKGAEVQSYPGLRQLGVDKVFFDLHTHSRAHFDQARREGFEVGGYTNPQWFPDGKDPKAYRSRVSQRLAALSLHDEQCDVQFNVEKLYLSDIGLDTPDEASKYILDLMYWWRRSNPNRVTSWTMEGHQGGWFYPILKNSLLSNVLLVPQAYDGDMRRWDSHGVVMDLVRHGAALERVTPFLDAPEARIPYSEGFFYMEHRLY